MIKKEIRPLLKSDNVFDEDKEELRYYFNRIKHLTYYC